MYNKIYEDKILLKLNGLLINKDSSFGGEGIWTPDLLRAKQTLSQLSYTPGESNAKLKVKNEKLMYGKAALKILIFRF